MGYLLVIVTNQSGVARGIVTEKGLDEIHHHLKKLLADEGVYIDAIYHCPYHPDGTVEHYSRESELRKPQPGMLLKAAQELDIDLPQSWMIGDSYRDVAAGHRAGCQTILLDTPGKTQIRQPNDPEPDKRAVNLREAVNILRMVEFQQKANAARVLRGQPEAAAINDETPEPESPASAPVAVASPAAVPAPSAPVLEPSTPPPAAPANAKELPASVPSLADETNSSPRPPEPPLPPDATTHQLLEDILHRVKSKSRYDQYAEFSVFMLLAWLVQALAAFSLVLSVWFWLDTRHGVEAVQTMIGYAVALELLVIALLMMHEKTK